jgi:hypothetical protein
VQHSNRVGGAGPVDGFDTTLGTGDALVLGSGLAIDGAGRVLLLPRPHTIPIATLLERSRRTTPAGETAVTSTQHLAFTQFEPCVPVALTNPVESPTGAELYLVTIAHAEAFCGEEPVYGRLCEDACTGTTDRPQRLEGIVVRALPLTLQTPLAASRVVRLDRRHLRSLVASAYFSDEARETAHLISGNGLRQETWCLGANATSRPDVPLAILARAGGQTVFLDAWAARRERIETPPRRYWAWRMMMRPWNVFLAHVLQFQCQLHELLLSPGTPAPIDDDPCRDKNDVLGKAAKYVFDLKHAYAEFIERMRAQPVAGGGVAFPVFSLPGGDDRIVDLGRLLGDAVRTPTATSRDRLLIHGGIVELPSAGYLPVVTGTIATVNTQVRALLGEGVDLRFCVVRPDFVAHALEEAQHMERISLLRGLDDPAAKPEVDILVPDGEIVETAAPPAGFGFVVRLQSAAATIGTADAPLAMRAAGADPAPGAVAQGAGRGEGLPTGGAAFHAAALLKTAQDASDVLVRPAVGSAAAVDVGRSGGVWATMETVLNPFSVRVGDSTPVRLVAVLAVTGRVSTGMELDVRGDLNITNIAPPTAAQRTISGRFVGTLSRRMLAAGAPAPEVSALDMAATLTLLTPAGGPPSFVAELALRDVRTMHRVMRFKATWSGSPLKARVVVEQELKVDVAGGQQERVLPLVIADLEENADVALPTNPSHLAAVRALHVVAAATGRPDFIASAERRLFPPAPPPTRDISVRARRDWVLFHRRRNKRCTIDAPPPVPRPPDRYRVYHVPVASWEEANKLQLALQQHAAGAFDAAAYQPVSTLEYPASATVLATDPTTFKTDWQAVVPDRRFVRFSFVARSGTTTDADLEGERLDSAEVALPDSAPVAPDRLRVLWDRFPSELAAADAAGVIVFFTTPAEQKTTCLEVFVVRERGTAKQLVERLRTNAVLRPELERLAQSLGVVAFEAGTDHVVSGLDDVAGAWSAQGGGFVGDAGVVAVAPAADDYASQAKAIISKLPSVPPAQPVPAVPVVPSPGALASDCPGILVLDMAALRPARVVLFREFFLGGIGTFGRPRVPLEHDVVRFADTALDTQDPGFDPVVQNLLNKLQGAEIESAILSLDIPPGATPSPDDVARLDALLKQLKQRGLRVDLGVGQVRRRQQGEAEYFTEGGQAVAAVVLLRM